MEKYYFTKTVNAAPFQEHLMLTMSKDVYRKIEAVNVNESIEDNIEIQTIETLISDELDEIINAVNSYDDSGSLAVRYGIEIGTMNKASSFGKSLVDKFASNNIVRGKHIQQIEYNGVTKPITSHIVDKHLVMIINMMTGSLTDVYRTLLALQPDELLSQEEIDEFKRRLEIYLEV